MYKYETHLHTYPVSKCAKAEVLECVEFYKEMGYDGIFITNHFLDGNVNTSSALPYKERIEFYFSDYEKALKLAEEIGIKVFFGLETSYKGTDFLVYGLDKEWFLKNSKIMDMKKKNSFCILWKTTHLLYKHTHLGRLHILSIFVCFQDVFMVLKS